MLEHQRATVRKHQRAPARRRQQECLGALARQRLQVRGVQQPVPQVLFQAPQAHCLEQLAGAVIYQARRLAVSQEHRATKGPRCLQLAGVDLVRLLVAHQLVDHPQRLLLVGLRGLDR